MRDRKKRNIIIGTLCSLIVFMGIGYAILSQTLSISGMANMKGDWDVRITNMELLSENTTGKAKEVSHSYTNTTASFEADLYMPGDSIEYKVTIKNNGNIDAVLKSITPTTTNKNANVEFSHSKIDNTPLKVGNEITFTMKVAFLESATSIPSNNISYTLVLNYIQYDGKSDYVQAVETTEESCFWVTNDGTLVSYDISCGTDIVVPASVDGIPIKRTALYFGATDGYANVIKEGDENPTSVFKNQSKLDKFIEEYGSDFSETELEEFRSTVIFFEELNSNISDYGTYKQTLISSGEEKKKISKDSSGTITFTTSTSDYNVIYVDENAIYPHKYYCTTEDACELLKEYFRLQSPALEKGISDSSYYEYAYASYGLLDDLDYLFILNMPVTYQNINSIDFSNAIYMENISLANIVGTSDYVIKKVIMPPNIEVLGKGSQIIAEEIIFPKNSTTKVISSYYSYSTAKKVTLPSSLKFIGSRSFANSNLDSVTIPASVVGIAESAFYNAGLNSLTFQPNSSLIALYGDEYNPNGHSVFEKNNLTSITIPASVEYIGSDVFSQNKLTSVTFQGNSNLKYLDTNAFRYNPDLPTVTMPS